MAVSLMSVLLGVVVCALVLFVSLERHVANSARNAEARVDAERTRHTAGTTQVQGKTETERTQHQPQRRVTTRRPAQQNGHLFEARSHRGRAFSAPR